MGEANKRKETSGLTRMIEASAQERWAINLVFERLVSGKGGNQPRLRQAMKQLKLGDIVKVNALLETKLEEEAKKAGPLEKPRPVKFSDFSSELREYEMTNDAIEYVSKTFADLDIPAMWLAYTGEVTDRMEDKSYTAPSQKVVEIAAEPAPAEEPKA